MRKLMKEIEGKVRENFNMAFENSMTGAMDSEDTEEVEDIEMDEE